MSTYGIGQDIKTREYYVVVDGVRVASYPLVESALDVEAHREHEDGFQEGKVAVETITEFLSRRELPPAWLAAAVDLARRVRDLRPLPSARMPRP